MLPFYYSRWKGEEKHEKHETVSQSAVKNETICYTDQTRLRKTNAMFSLTLQTLDLIYTLKHVEDTGRWKWVCGGRGDPHRKQAQCIKMP